MATLAEWEKTKIFKQKNATFDKAVSSSAKKTAVVNINGEDYFLSNDAELIINKSLKTDKLIIKNTDYSIDEKDQAKKRVKRIDRAIKELRNEAIKRCTKNSGWRLKNNSNIWVVSSEAREESLSTGGLGDIASDLLPLIEKSKNRAVSVNPMYVGEQSTKCAKKFEGKVAEDIDGTVIYSFKNKNLKLKKIASILIKELNETADIYAHEADEIINLYIRNDKYFNVYQEEVKKAEGGIGPYTSNRFSNEIDRFAFFSKVIGEFILKLKQAESTANNDFGIEPPDLLILNDWQSTAVAPILKVLAPLKELVGELGEGVAKKIQNIKLISIIHNLAYNGIVEKPAHGSAVLNMLFGGYASLIAKNLKLPVGRGSGVAVNDRVNLVKMGLSSSDRAFTVSPQYAEEISTQWAFGYSFVDILDYRKKHNTFTGILNGAVIENFRPNKKNVAKINNVLGTNFKSFTLKTNNENKKEIIEFWNRLISQNAMPQDTSLEGVDTDSMIFSVCARITHQKGIDIILNSMKEVAKKINKVKDVPVVSILGQGSENDLGKLFNVKNELLKSKNKILQTMGRRILINTNFDPSVEKAMYLSSDFFLMASRFEPCGLTPHKTLSCGLPVVTLNNGGPGSMIIDGENGIVAPFCYVKDIKNNEKMTESELNQFQDIKNIQVYTKAIHQAMKIYKDKSRYNTMSQNAYQSAQELDWNKLGKQHIKLLKTGKLPH